MFSRSKKSTSRRRPRQRNGRERNRVPGLGPDGPDPRGDIPRRRKVTISTVSCPIPPTTQMCCFRQMVEKSVLTVSNTTPTAVSYYFTFGDIDQSSTLASLWDQYRFEAIRFSLLPQNNAIQLVTNSTTSLQELYCVIDYDDTTNLGSVSAARQYDNCIILAPGESLERTFQPRMAVSAYSGGFGSYANLGPVWIDCASTGVNFYGIKVYIPTATASQSLLQSWNIQVEYFVSFRGLR